MNIRRAKAAALCFVALVSMTHTWADGRGNGGRHDGGQRARPTHHGERVHELPRDRVRVHVDRRDYYYGHRDGRRYYYRPYGRDYVVVRPPIGAFVTTLPFGWVSFWIGPRRYFWVDDTYYLWEPLRREYVVVRRPEGAREEALSDDSAESTRVFAYPTRGQSEALADRDRYECHLWATRESGFDPEQPEARRDAIPDYRRAMSACLEGRGYAVK